MPPTQHSTTKEHKEPMRGTQPTRPHQVCRYHRLRRSRKTRALSIFCADIYLARTLGGYLRAVRGAVHPQGRGAQRRGRQRAIQDQNPREVTSSLLQCGIKLDWSSNTFEYITRLSIYALGCFVSLPRVVSSHTTQARAAHTTLMSRGFAISTQSATVALESIWGNTAEHRRTEVRRRLQYSSQGERRFMSLLSVIMKRGV